MIASVLETQPILCDGSQFQWYVIPLFTLVLFAGVLKWI